MYQGIIKQSRTLDLMAFLMAFNGIFPVLVEQLPTLGVGVKTMAAVNLLGAAVGWYLRFQTTSAVGEK